MKIDVKSKGLTLSGDAKFEGKLDISVSLSAPSATLQSVSGATLNYGGGKLGKLTAGGGSGSGSGGGSGSGSEEDDKVRVDGFEVLHKGNLPSPTLSVELTGDVTGNGAVTFDHLGNASLIIDTKSLSGSGVTSFNGRTGAVSLTSNDVVDALGFLPSANAATAETANNSLNLGGQTPAFYLNLANSTGTLPAARLSGTYNININGNANTATTAASAAYAEEANTASWALNSSNAVYANSAGYTTTANNANYAGRLSTARVFTLSGDVTGNVAFDGSSNVVIQTVVSDTDLVRTSTTNLGKTGNGGIDTGDKDAAWWGALPNGYTKMTNFTAANTGAPTNGFGYVFKMARRDNSNGGYYLYGQHSTGSATAPRFWIGKSSDASTYPNWAEVYHTGNFTPTLYARLNQSVEFSGVSVSGPVGSSRTLFFNSGSSTRWALDVQGSVESGSNVGSELTVNRYNDAGTYIDTVLSISRSSGVAHFAHRPLVNGNEIWDKGNLDLTNVVFTNVENRFTGVQRFTAVGRPGLEIWDTATYDGNAVRFGPQGGISFATAGVWQSGSFANLKDALYKDREGSLPKLTIAGAAGTGRQLRFDTGTSPRWTINTNGIAESGSNVGSDLTIDRYTDAGAYIGNILIASRATGVVNFAQMPTVNGAPIGGNIDPGNFAQLGAANMFTQPQLIQNGGNVTGASYTNAVLLDLSNFNPVLKFTDRTTNAANMAISWNGATTVNGGIFKLEADINKDDTFAKNFLTLNGSGTATVFDTTIMSNGILNYQGTIGTTQDLNTYVTPGVWHCSSNANASGGANFPVPVAGLLEVFANALGITGSGFIYQRYTSYNASGHGRQWHREYYNGSWSPWKRSWDSDVFDPANFARMDTPNTFTANQTFNSLIPVRAQQSASTGAGFVDLAGVSANRSGSVVFRNAAGDRLGFVGNADTGGSLYITADVPNIVINRRPTFAGNLAWDAGNLSDPARTGAINVFSTEQQIVGYPSSSGQLRLKLGANTSGYGAIHRMDNTNYYILATNNNDADGTWNSLRPLTINMGSGVVTLANGANIGGGGLTITSGSLVSVGNIDAPEILATNWFRAKGSGGLYWEAYGGGWNMSDTVWVRSYNGKNVYTAGEMRAGTGFTIADASIGFGGDRAKGFYTDPTNVAIRATSASGSVFFQSASGSKNYAIFGDGSLEMYRWVSMNGNLLTFNNNRGLSNGIRFASESSADMRILHKAANVIHITNESAGYETFSFTSAGALWARDSVTAPNVIGTSDESLKHNITDLENVDDLVARVKAVRFKWKADDTDAIGFIAQQMEPLFPELVHTDGNGVKGFNYQAMTAVLVKALQSTNAKIDSIEERLAKAGL